VFFNGLNFVEKCDFSFEDKHRITYIWRSLMNICMNLKKVEPKKITTTKELAQYILESGNDVEKMSEEDRSRMDAQITAKLQSGKKLSQKEMDYLRKTNVRTCFEGTKNGRSCRRTAKACKEQGRG
jgi:uncharacterized membrane protein